MGIHCLSATVVFNSFALIAALYLIFVFPVLDEALKFKNTRIQLENATDLKWKIRCCYSLCYFLPLAFFVRVFHITHSVTFWAYPLLFVELFFVQITMTGLLLGNYNTMKEIDLEKPIEVFPLNYFFSIDDVQSELQTDLD